MQLLSLPTQLLNRYCFIEDRRHWGGYSLWAGEFRFNPQHDNFISKVPELSPGSLSRFYGMWKSPTVLVSTISE